MSTEDELAQALQRAEAAEQALENILNPTIRRLHVEGSQLNLSLDAKEMARFFAVHFHDVLDESKTDNYVELTFATPEKPLKKVVVTVRRVFGKTPNDLKKEAERERDAAIVERDAARSDCAVMAAERQGLREELAQVRAEEARLRLTEVELRETLRGLLFETQAQLACYKQPLTEIEVRHAERQEKIDNAARRAADGNRLAALCHGRSAEHDDRATLLAVVRRLQAEREALAEGVRLYRVAHKAVCGVAATGFRDDEKCTASNEADDKREAWEREHGRLFKDGGA
jgi:hypothetical protein